VYFSDVIVSKMRVKSRLTDVSKWFPTIRRACHALFLYELKGYRYVLFCWCHDPPRTPQTLSAGQGPDRTDVRTGHPADELGHQTGLTPGRVGPNRPVSGDSEVSERTGNPGNPKTGPDIPTVYVSVFFFSAILGTHRACTRCS